MIASRRHFALGVALAVVAASTLAGCGGNGGTPTEPTPSEPTPLTKLIRSPTLLRAGSDGKRETLVTDVALKGKSNVALFFGASWCSYTRAFIDGLTRLHQDDREAEGQECC